MSESALDSWWKPFLNKLHFCKTEKFYELKLRRITLRCTYRWTTLLVVFEVFQENVSYEFSCSIKAPTLSEEKTCVDCLLGELCNLWKVWPKRKPPDSCLHLHTNMIIAIAIFINIIMNVNISIRIIINIILYFVKCVKYILV